MSHCAKPFPVGWSVGGELPRINVDTDVWGELSIMTGVYQHWWLSTLHIGWGLCDSVCLVSSSRLQGQVGVFWGGSSLSLFITRTTLY